MGVWLIYGQVILIVITLSICGVFDIKYKMIPISVILLFGAVSILFFILIYRDVWINHLEGACVGILILVVSKVTKGSIGEGDALLLIFLGLLLGLREVGLILIIAVTLGAVWSGILIVFRKANRKTAFPFVPFLLTSYIICLL